MIDILFKYMRVVLVWIAIAVVVRGYKVFLLGGAVLDN